MTGEIDLEVFKRGYAAVGAKDWDEAMAVYHPEIEWHEPPELPEAASYVGHDGVRAAWEKFDEAWDEWHLEPLEYEQIGDDRLLVRVRITRTRHRAAAWIRPASSSSCGACVTA